MNCEHAAKLLDAVFDDEVDAASSAEFRAHLQGCPACAARWEERVSLSDMLHAMPRMQAPAPLRAAVASMASREHTGAAVRWPMQVPAWRPWQARRTLQAWRTWQTWRGALTLAGVAALAFALGLGVARRANEPPPLDEIVALHAATLTLRGAPEPFSHGVPSDDRHTVKPWLASRIDFAPPVPDLQSLGFRLQGARIEPLRHTRAAVLTWHIRNHALDLIVWRTDESAGEHAATAAPSFDRWRGFGMARWTESGLHHVAVSDVDAADLQRFVAALVRSQ